MTIIKVPSAQKYPNDNSDPDHLDCQNINSFPVEWLYESLTLNGKSWIAIKRSDNETNVDMAIERFTKCEEINQTENWAVHLQ